jgi:hypothetical protein
VALGGGTHMWPQQQLQQQPAHARATQESVQTHASHRKSLAGRLA